MSEKKLFSIDVAMDEPMYLAIKGLAEADGISASELIRMLCATMISERQAYYSRLHSIFGQVAHEAKPKQSGKNPDSAQSA